MREPIENEYFNWLCAKVIDRNSNNYLDLLRILHNTEFVWLIPADKHRAYDGIELREDFLRETFTKREPHWGEEPCSIFEMLYSLAKRASFQTDIPARDWFWDFMTNLQLDECRHVDESNIEIIDHILHVFIWRIYDPSGLGGIFPMSSTPNDQREIEIWYQFHEYLEDRGLM